MATKTPWHIFLKCFKNQATAEELEEVNNWLNDDSENVALLENIYNTYSISSNLPPLLKPDIQKAWKKVDRETGKTKPVFSTFNRKIKYFAAAVVVLLIGLNIIFYLNGNGHSSNQFSEIITQSGEKTNVKLPDGSTVWLNSSSSIKYSTEFNKKKREIILSGEAYFEVAKNDSKKFRVKSGSLFIDVYGTSFNISNYPTNNFQKITVAGGIVGIATNLKEIKKLTKGEQAVLNKQSGKIWFTKDDPELVTAWKNNELVFRDTPIEEVVRSLESWFGVEIKLEKEMIGGHSYSFRIKTESLREVMDMMKIMTPFDYKINGKDVEMKYNQ